jgi:hypothetical protein
MGGVGRCRCVCVCVCVCEGGVDDWGGWMNEWMNGRTRHTYRLAFFRSMKQHHPLHTNQPTHQTRTTPSTTKTTTTTKSACTYTTTNPPPPKKNTHTHTKTRTQPDGRVRTVDCTALAASEKRTQHAAAPSSSSSSKLKEMKGGEGLGPEKQGERVTVDTTCVYRGGVDWTIYSVYKVRVLGLGFNVVFVCVCVCGGGGLYVNCEHFCTATCRTGVAVASYRPLPSSFFPALPP